jgi:hypothetical protein
MDELTIHIFPASDGGYMYDIYDCGPDECYNGGGERECVDGGQCTSTLKNALDMAQGQAHDLIKRAKKH